MTATASVARGADMPMQDHWRGRTRYTVFDSDHGDGDVSPP